MVHWVWGVVHSLVGFISVVGTPQRWGQGFDPHKNLKSINTQPGSLAVLDDKPGKATNLDLAKKF
jgi:hypothetical protein